MACLVTPQVVFLFSCQKDDTVRETPAIARVNVINAVVGGGTAKANVSNKERSWSNISSGNPLSYGVNNFFLVPTASSTVLKVAPVSDTTKLWYNSVADLQTGKVYSLYLSGTASAIDTLFKEETSFQFFAPRDLRKPLAAADSVTYISFANMSSGSPVVNIHILNNPTPIVSNLGYRQTTEFKACPANGNTLTFQVRRSTDNQLIITYNLNTNFYRFKSGSFVISGTYVTPPAPPVTGADAYRVIGVPYF